MPVRVIGMIGVAPPARAASLVVIEGALAPGFVAEFARVHERAGFDMVLVGYSSSSAEGFLVALHAAAHTERLGFLVAHRPGFVAPTLMARKIATFDQLTRGRLALHIITGKSDREQEGDGDFTPKAERYVRATEYLHLMKRTWAARAPFDFAGSFYRAAGAHSDVAPYQQPHPPIYFGGASQGALAMGTAECDVYAIYAEPRATTAERIADVRARAAARGRTIGFNMSVRPIIAASEGAAWDKARTILSAMVPGNLGWSRQEGATAPVDVAGRRQMDFALEREVHDERLWMGITKATGALGNTSCLVGTAEQVADALAAYYRLGINSFLVRGFDPVADAEALGRELIPRLRARVAEIDRQEPGGAGPPMLAG